MEDDRIRNRIIADEEAATALYSEMQRRELAQKQALLLRTEWMLRGQAA